MDSYGKSTEGFRKLKTSLEPETMDLGVERTSLDRFFVCSAGAAPAVESATHQLTIDGDAAGSPVTLSFDELAALPQHEVVSWIECAGNGRRLYEFVDGHVPTEAQTDTKWTLGAMAMASWTGPRLAEVISAAEPTDDLAWIAPTGVDVDNTEGEPVRICLPIDKALDPDTIVALGMNGQPLPQAHGAPMRLLVPGWVGAYSVKWLGRLELSTTWVNSWRADTYYRLRDPDGTDRGPATAHPVKSSVALPWGAELAAGPQVLSGYARCGTSRVALVEYAVDDGDWADADLQPVDGKWAWTPFSFTWDAAPGPHTIRTRATTEDGQTQPDSVPYHPNTILWNAVTPHPVVVAE